MTRMELLLARPLSGLGEEMMQPQGVLQAQADQQAMLLNSRIDWTEGGKATAVFVAVALGLVGIWSLRKGKK